MNVLGRRIINKVKVRPGVATHHDAGIGEARAAKNVMRGRFGGMDRF
jgi:hypothetical protein